MDQLDTDYSAPGGPRKTAGMPWWPAALVGVLVLGGVGWYFWNSAPEPEVELPVAERSESDADTEPEVPPAPEWDVPTLGESDDFLRDVAARLSSHPEWLSWIATEELVGRFVGAVDEVARGEIPKAQIGFLTPTQGFSIARASTESGVFEVSPDSYRRYSRLSAVVAGLDVDGAVALFRRLEPLLDQAYRGLGYPNAEFEPRLIKAAEVLLATPSVEGPIPVVRSVRSYKFADPALEELLPIQKLLLRLGPENLVTIKRKVRAISRELAADAPDSAKR